jgi:hypothetical protein
MEVEDEDAILERLFFKKYGRALPEKEKEKEKDEVDQINMNLIDLTQEDDEMEVATPVVVVKTEPIETPENVPDVTNVTNVTSVADVSKRRSFRLERLELAKARKAITEFGKSLRKTDVIPEKETPLANENVITVNNESGNNVNVEPLTTDEAIEMAEAAIAESDAEIAATQKVIDEFDDESEFRLFPDDTDVINDEDDAMIDDI